MTAPVSLSNYFHAISYNQFLDFTNEVVTSLQNALHTSCSVSVSGMPMPKSCADAMDDTAKEAARERLSHGHYDAAVGEDAWNAAHHVEVFITSDEDRKPLASIEFKGCLPKTATFNFLAAGEGKVRSGIVASHPEMIKGHGYISHDDKTQWSLCL